MGRQNRIGAIRLDAWSTRRFGRSAEVTSKAEGASYLPCGIAQLRGRSKWAVDQAPGLGVGAVAGRGDAGEGPGQEFAERGLPG